MKFTLQVQVNKTQDSELSLTPRRNLRTGPDKFYFFKNLTLCPTERFKCLFKLKGREKYRHLSVCYIRRPWKTGKKKNISLMKNDLQRTRLAMVRRLMEGLKEHGEKL